MAKKAAAPEFVMPTLEEVYADLSRRHLRHFIRHAWHTIEPATPYIESWFIDAIAEHLEAVSKRQIKRLIVNIPPRMLKSISISIMWPVWSWIAKPSERFIFSSYSDDLSTKHSVDRRTIIKSDWYQHNWSRVFKLSKDQDEKHEFQNDKRGVMIASSVGGPPFGKGADVLIGDDLLNPEDARSDTKRETVNRFFDDTFASRLNDPKTGAIVLVMQRLHDEDIAGKLLVDKDWDRLILPMEYEGVRSRTVLGWSDPRKTIGEPLHPARFGPAEIANCKARGSYIWNGQYQQRPAPEEGALFKRHYWQYWQPAGANLSPIRVRFPDGETRDVPAVTLPGRFDEVLQSWDAAFKGLDDSDFVVGQVWARTGANRYLLDQRRARMDFPATLQAVRALSREYPEAQAKLIEDKANGPAVISMLKNEIVGLIPVNPQGGKFSRASAVAPQCESGNVYLPHPALMPWVDAMIDEFASFPNGSNDDCVDAASQSLARMGTAGARQLFPEFEYKSHVSETDNLRGWWSRWISLWWGEQCAAHWYCLDAEKRVRIYREFTCQRTGAQDFAAQVARLSVDDLESVSHVIAWASPECFDAHARSKSVAQSMTSGFASVLGQEAAFLWDFTSDERMMEPERAKVSLAARRKKASATKIMIQHVKGESEAAWEHARDLMRVTPVGAHGLIDYDRDTARRILDEDDRVRKFRQYMEAVEGSTSEILPKILIHAGCATTISALSAASRDENDPGKLAETPHEAVLESFALGMLAHREEQAQMPREVFVEHRLNLVTIDDPQARHMAAYKAESDWKKTAVPHGMRFARRQRVRI